MAHAYSGTARLGTGEGRAVQRARPKLVSDREVGGRTRVKQLLDRFNLAARARRVERRSAMLVDRVWMGTRLE